MEQTRAPEKGRTEQPGLGTGPTTALLRGLYAEARRAPDGEAYLELAHGLGYRLAIALKRRDPRAPQHSLVVLIDSPLRAGPDGRIPRGPFARVEAALAARGYLSMRLDNGWMAHERAVPASRVASEWRFLRRVLEPQAPRMEGDR